MTNKSGDIIMVMQDSVAYMIEVGWTIVDKKEKNLKTKDKKDK